MAGVQFRHYVIATILTFSFPCILSLSVGADIDPMEVCWTASILWEPLALIPQAILYRRYRQVEGLTGASFLFLMGLYRFLYIINWIYRANAEKHFKHHPLVYLCGGAQLLIASCALFWPDGSNEGDMLAAPILTQIFQFSREVYCGMLGLLLLFGLIFIAQPDFQDRDSADVVYFAMVVGLALLVLTPPACFFYMYCDKTSASANLRGDDHDEVLDELTLPLVEQTREGTASDDPTLVERTSLPTESQSDTEYEAPSTSPNDADGIAVV